MLTKKGDEFKQRRYQRATCDFRSEFQWGTITHEARAGIISIGGCFLASDVKIPVGEEINLKIEMGNGGGVIECKAQVAWITGRAIQIRGKEKCQGFAVEFIKIFPEDRGRIDEFVRETIRVFRVIDHELKKTKPDKVLVRDLFTKVRPGESTHIAHIRKAGEEERRHYRLSR